LKFERLQKWCEDVNSRQNKVIYKALYIKQEEWDKNKPKNFNEVIKVFS
jgi:type III restriction enzyme